MILAGGTGGHIYPALAVARELREQGCEVAWMGTKAGMEARLVPAAGFPIEWLSVTGFRGKGLVAKLKAPFKLARACWQAARILLRARPNVILGMGGFVAGPGGFVARLLRIPLVVHEQNRIPGTTNRMLVKWARVVLEAFPDSFPVESGALWVGNPLRREMTQPAPAEKTIRGEQLKVLVLGGSQGAMALNRAVPEAVAGAMRLEGGRIIEVLHQTGESMHAETQALYQRLGVEARVVAYIENMAEAYRWADLAVCRAGAMTVSELMAAGLPAVLVPYPHAIDDHQTHNARYLADSGAAVLIPQPELTPERLSRELTHLSQEPGRLAEMSRRARTLAKLDAARVVADVCLHEAHA
jgi:UDP-N-acetylglucosamine--N-acetylmuramyl-(pentapeptide) pyrophosphoryl-undecaprenol N-acetylglucosamine transferase